MQITNRGSSARPSGQQRQKCFLVCNAHLDPVWLWPWEEGLVEAISTFRVAADFCDRHAAFRFNHNEAVLYEWVERNDPGLFRRIQRHVKSGRWNITGGAYLQPDLIAASGESMIRHFLIGKNYFWRKFGVEPTTAYNFDSFGHSQGLIQILSGCGMDSYIFCRPNRAALKIPVGAFRWRHASGAEVIARRSDDHYLTQGYLLQNLVDGKWEEFHREEGDFLFLWGLGNHGGGPSRAEYADLQRLPEVLPGIDFIESTPEEFFRHTLAARGRASLPVVTGDFKPCMEGCYTSMYEIKRRHRRVENLLYAVEKYAANAWWRKRSPYPSKDLEVAWKDLLFSEFHDLVTGSGTEKVEQDGFSLLGHAEEILRRRRAELLIALLRDESLAERNETPIFVFNPHPWEVTQEVEIDFGIDRQFSPDGVSRLLRSQGVEVDAQFEKADENLWNPSWGEWRSRAVFLATIPALSYRRFDTDYVPIPEKEIKRWRSPGLGCRKRLVVETPDLRVTLNVETGLLDGMEHAGTRVLLGGSCQWAVFRDWNHSWLTPKEWCEPEAVFRLATPAEVVRIIGSQYTHHHFPEGKPPVSILEDGPARIIIQAVFIHGASYVVQRYVINRKRPVIHLEQTIFWAEHDAMLRMELKHRHSIRSLQAEKCYSIDDETEAARPGHEMDFQRFLRISDPEGEAFAVVSHGTHAFRHRGNRLRMGVLRSPSFATHEENIGPTFDRYLDRHIPRQEQGMRQSKFTLLFGSAAATTAATVRGALEANVPLDPFVYFPTRKSAARAPESFVSTTAPNVLVTVVKKAESSSELVLRLWETAGRKTRCRLQVGQMSFPVILSPWRLNTYRLSRKGHLTACDLIEREESTGAYPEKLTKGKQNSDTGGVSRYG